MQSRSDILVTENCLSSYNRFDKLWVFRWVQITHDFDFEIVNFPYLDGDIPRLATYCVCFSQLIQFANVSSHVTDFNTRNKLLTAKLLNHKVRKAFSKLYRLHFD